MFPSRKRTYRENEGAKSTYLGAASADTLTKSIYLKLARPFLVAILLSLLSLARSLVSAGLAGSVSWTALVVGVNV